MDRFPITLLLVPCLLAIAFILGGILIVHYLNLV